MTCKVQALWTTHIRILFKPQLFLGGIGFRPHVSGIRICNFLNPLSRVEIFEYAT